MEQSPILQYTVVCLNKHTNPHIHSHTYINTHTHTYTLMNTDIHIHNPNTYTHKFTYTIDVKKVDKQFTHAMNVKDRHANGTFINKLTK